MASKEDLFAEAAKHWDLERRYKLLQKLNGKSHLDREED
jgi:hypothetical protein